MENQPDYIPKNGCLCNECIKFDECPIDYICPSLDRLIKFEMENEEL